MQLATKQDFRALMHLFLDPLKPYYSAEEGPVVDMK